MRTVLLLPLISVVAVLGGCGSKGRESAALAQPHRDLTLPSSGPNVEIASSVELKQLRTPRTAHPRTPRRSSSIQPKVVFAAVAAPALIPAVYHPVAVPASTVLEPANDHELPPGKTVTAIPVSSGPSTAAEPADETPTATGRHYGGGRGGRCGGRGRGPGIGIAAAPRPDFR
jgi:hypothetical protein